MQNVTPIAIAALAFELAPAVLFGLATERVARTLGRWPVAARVCLPGLLVAPYGMVSISAHMFQWTWFALYALLPVAVAALLLRAAATDADQRGDWRDAFVLLVLGLAVDLRWFDSAWPNGLRALNELFLVDAGLYGFLAIRQLSGTGFDFHLKWSDWKDRPKGACFLHASGSPAGTGAGLHPSASQPAGNRQRAPALGGNILPHRRARRTLLSRLGAELARAPRGPSRGTGDRVDPVRPVTLQQTVRTLQLALRSAGGHRRDFLRTCMARAPARARIDDHPRQRGLVVGAVVLEAGAARHIKGFDVDMEILRQLHNQGGSHREPI